MIAWVSWLQIRQHSGTWPSEDKGRMTVVRVISVHYRLVDVYADEPGDSGALRHGPRVLLDQIYLG